VALTSTSSKLNHFEENDDQIEDQTDIN